MDRPDYRDSRTALNIGIHGLIRNIVGIQGPVRKIGIHGPLCLQGSRTGQKYKDPRTGQKYSDPRTSQENRVHGPL